MATTTAAANTEIGKTPAYENVDRSWSPKAGTTNAAPSASKTNRPFLDNPLAVDESRDAEYAAKLVKHSLIGAASAAFSRLVWLTPIFNYKTELQTDDLVMADLVEEDMLQSKRRREMAREDWWNYIWRGLTSEFALQSGIFLLSRAVWHNKRYGLLNYLGDANTQRIVTTNATGDAVMSTIVARRDHNLFTTVLQNALTSTILYPLYKYRVQKALCLDSENDERESSTIINNNNQFGTSATTSATSTLTTTTAPQYRRRLAASSQYTSKQPKFFLFNTDFGHVQNESFKSYFLYNVLLGAGSFFIEKLLREQWFGGSAKSRIIASPADAREESTWSYYLAQTITKLLLNPLEVSMKKKIVEDSVGGASKIKSNLDRDSSSSNAFGEYFKGALFTIPEMLFTGLTEFYMYRWLNRSIGPHDRDE